VTDTTVRDFLIGSVVKYASDGKNNVPLSDWYDASTGLSDGFQARPVVGGHLGLVSAAILCSQRTLTRMIQLVL
jgi:hypothetical protein